MRYGVCTSVLRSGDLATDVRWAVQAGATDLAVTLDDVRLATPAVARHHLEAASLGLSSVMTGLSYLSFRGASADEEAVDEALEACRATGGQAVTVVSGPLEARSIDEADELGRKWFERMAPRAAERGVRLLLEPLHPIFRRASYVHTLRHGADLVSDLPGAGLVLDVTHVWWDRGLRTDIAELGHLIGMVQLADMSREALVKQRYERCQLGDGVIPLAEIVGDLAAAGYGGVCENEVRIRVPRDERVALVAAGRVWFEHALSGC